MTQAEERRDVAPEGAAAESASPQRRCIVTRTPAEKAELIRFVLGPDGDVVPDLAERLPGHGYWVRADRATLTEAVKKNAFAKAMRAPVKPAADLPDRVAALVERQVVDLLGLARRGGKLVAGYEKVDGWLRTGRAALLIEASDAGADGRSKLARHTHPGVEIWSPLTGAALGRAVGRDHAVHIAVSPGGLAQRLKTALRRQQGFADRPSGPKTGASQTISDKRN
ncbi:MAG TPA: RNA-binding protein [Dongiaceae bacterium]